MTVPTGRRVPRGFPRRLADSIETVMPGTVGGRLAGVASPAMYGEDDVAAGGSGTVGSAGPVVAVGVADDLFGHDVFDLTADGAQDLTLDKSPLSGSVHLALNGIKQRYGVDFTWTDNTLSILTAMGALTGDAVDVHYAYTNDLPADPETG